MGRPPKYDRDKLLDKALQLFWRKGFENTSIQELIHTLDVHPGSLYQTFGDKDDLFNLVFDRYLETLALPVLKTLQSKQATIDDLEYFFTMQLDLLGSPISSKGCLITNTMSNPGAHTSAIMKKALAYQAKVEAILRRVLQQAVDRREIKQLSPTSIQATAALLNTFLHGMRVVARSRPSAKQVQNMTRGVRELLDSLKN